MGGHDDRVGREAELLAQALRENMRRSSPQGPPPGPAAPGPDAAATPVVSGDADGASSAASTRAGGSASADGSPSAGGSPSETAAAGWGELVTGAALLARGGFELLGGALHRLSDLAPPPPAGHGGLAQTPPWPADPGTDADADHAVRRPVRRRIPLVGGPPRADTPGDAPGGPEPGSAGAG